MTFEIAKRFLDDLFFFKKGMNSIIFTFLVADRQILDQPIILDFFGGECTLHIDLIDKICAYFEEQCKTNKYTDWLTNYSIKINTNGTTFLTASVKKFYEKYGQHINTSLSIDGCKKCHDTCRVFANGHGSYDIVELAVKEHIKQFNEAPRTKLTFSIENMQYIKDSIENLIKLGYKNLDSSFDVCTTLNKTQSDLYYNYLKQAIDYIIDNKINLNWSLYWEDNFKTSPSIKICGHDGSAITVNWDGNIYGCQQLSGSFTNNDSIFCLGTVYNGISKHGQELIDYFRYKQAFDIKKGCLNCSLLATCPICQAVNYLKNKNIQKIYINCGVSVAENRARLYFAKCAKETNYPYFKDIVDNILKFIKYDPNADYLVNYVV